MKRVEWVGAAVFTFESRKITDVWVLGDLYGLLQDLAKNATAVEDLQGG